MYVLFNYAHLGHWWVENGTDMKKRLERKVYEKQIYELKIHATFTGLIWWLKEIRLNPIC